MLVSNILASCHNNDPIMAIYKTQRAQFISFLNAFKTPELELL